MKILFIKPNPAICKQKKYRLSFFEKITAKLNVFSPPLAFPMLAAVTPKFHELKMIDERLHKINFEGKYDIVGISALTNEAIRAYEIADLFRKKKVTVVLGGCHVSARPEEAKKHADCVVIGEAEETWPQLLKDFEKNELKDFYYPLTPVNLSKIPLPNREILNRILVETGVQTSRGCPYACEYCYIGNSPYSRTYRKRSVKTIVKEIENIPQKIIVFYDTSLTIDISHTKSLFKALKDMNKKLICLGNIDVLNKNDEILTLAKEAGCFQWNLGFESVTQKSLNEIGKKTNTVSDYYKIVKKIHEHKMNVHGFFMFGFDHDTKDVFDKTIEFIKKSKMDSADFSILTPLPGTPIFDRFLEQGRILTDNWSKYSYQNNVVFEPKNFFESELLIGFRSFCKEYA